MAHPLVGAWGRPDRTKSQAFEELVDLPIRYFKIKKGRCPRTVKWLNYDTVYEGQLLSMTSRSVRLYAPDEDDKRPHFDVSYDWLVPARSA